MVHSVGDNLKFSNRGRIISAHFHNGRRGDPPLILMKGDESDSALIQPFPKRKRLLLQSFRLQYRQGDPLIYSD